MRNPGSITSFGSLSCLRATPPRDLWSFRFQLQEAKTDIRKLVPTGFVTQNASDGAAGRSRSATSPLVTSATSETTGFDPPIPLPAQPQSREGGPSFSDATPRRTLVTLDVADNLDAKVKNAQGVVLIDFYADWCGPCRRQGRILHNMQAQAGLNSATIIKVNIEKHRHLARKYGVSGLPTMIVMKQGTVVGRQVGLASESKVAELLRL